MINKKTQIDKKRNIEVSGFDSNENTFDFENITNVYTDQLDDLEVEKLRNKMLDAILKRIDQETQKKQQDKKFRGYSRYAAVLFPFLIIGLIFFQYFQPKKFRIETASGEIKELTLQDGSLVILNEESILEYSTSRLGDFNREVILKGEAYFEVNKLATGKEFSINKDSNFAIEVLGTSFNFTNRKENTAIALVTGSVALKLREKQETLMLKAGEVAKIDEKTGYLNVRESKSITAYSAWRNGKLKLIDNSLIDILEILQELYGFEVSPKIISETDSKSFSGTIPIGKDPHETILNLSVLFETPMVLENNELRLKQVPMSA